MPLLAIKIFNGLPLMEGVVSDGKTGKWKGESALYL